MCSLSYSYRAGGYRSSISTYVRSGSSSYIATQPPNIHKSGPFHTAGPDRQYYCPISSVTSITTLLPKTSSRLNIPNEHSHTHTRKERNEKKKEKKKKIKEKRRGGRQLIKLSVHRSSPTSVILRDENDTGEDHLPRIISFVSRSLK